MWNHGKSVVLSSVCTKLVIALLIAFGVTAPYLMEQYIGYTDRDAGLLVPILVTIYSCCIFAFAALFSLNCLLNNIKRGDVFVDRNVKCLRIISWCCFAVSLILLISGGYYLLYLIVALAAAFFGLILRVVKNVIEQAILIKNENDLTI